MYASQSSVESGFRETEEPIITDLGTMRSSEPLATAIKSTSDK